MKPILQALLLADHVYQDKLSGKKIIAGTFNRLCLQPPIVVEQDDKAGDSVEVPISAVLRPGNPYAYINLTEIRGKIEIYFRLVHLESNEVVFESSPIPIESDDPLASVELVLPVLDLPRKPGDYAFELLWNNEIIGSHRIKVIQLKKEE